MAWCPGPPVIDSTFTSDPLPVHTRSSKRQGSSSTTRSSARGKRTAYRGNSNRVLLFGRIQELALYRAEVLRDRGFEVRTSTSKEEAVNLIRRGDFDAAVLSYTLSSDTVEELAEEVREICPHCPLVVIAKSLRLDRKITPDAVALADDGPKALVSALRRVLRKH
jgi:CheY-like chemotaxis protein